MTPRYRWLLFDADDTLFDYRRAEACALEEAFEAAGVPLQPTWMLAYRKVNARAWRELESGRISAARLRVQRFEGLFRTIGVSLDPAAFAAVYLRRLAAQSWLMDGALEVIDPLRADHRLAIVTNGLADVQRPRLAASPIASHIAHLIVSEEVGAAKPQPAIFEAALERMGGPDPRAVLMIGDSLRSDIAGGDAFGLDTCWFNPAGLPADGGPAATYEIRRLAELPGILAG